MTSCNIAGRECKPKGVFFKPGFTHLIMSFWWPAGTVQLVITCQRQTRESWTISYAVAKFTVLHLDFLQFLHNHCLSGNLQNMLIHSYTADGKVIYYHDEYNNDVIDLVLTNVLRYVRCVLCHWHDFLVLVFLLETENTLGIPCESSLYQKSEVFHNNAGGDKVVDWHYTSALTKLPIITAAIWHLIIFKKKFGMVTGVL